MQKQSNIEDKKVQYVVNRIIDERKVKQKTNLFKRAEIEIVVQTQHKIKEYLEYLIRNTKEHHELTKEQN